MIGKISAPLQSGWTKGIWTGVLVTFGLVILAPGCAKKGFPDKFKDDREAFDQSIMAFWEASNMFKRKPGQSMVMRTPGQEAQYFALLERGITLSHSVSDDFLDYVNADLKVMYRDTLITGKRLYREGAQSGNRVMQSQGSEMVLKWEQFWETHQKEIALRIYPEAGHDSEPAAEKS